MTSTKVLRANRSSKIRRISSIDEAPTTIRSDYGPAFISKALKRWAYESDLTLDFSRPGKATDNAFVESSDGRLRAECPNAHRLLAMTNARAKVEASRRDYNESRPHTPRGWMTLAEYAAEAAAKATE